MGRRRLDPRESTVALCLQTELAARNSTWEDDIHPLAVSQEYVGHECLRTADPQLQQFTSIAQWPLRDNHKALAMELLQSLDLISIPSQETLFTQQMPLCPLAWAHTDL